MKRLIRPLRARAFCMAEAAVSILIVGTMLVAALQTVGAARLTEYKVAQRARGLHLAEELLTEILQQDYADREIDEDDFGLAAIKVGTGSRSLWTDVDDYDSWSEPPQRVDGTLLPDLIGWVRSVSVDWLNPDDLSATVNTNMGIKRITVDVSFNGLYVISLSALRTNTPEPKQPGGLEALPMTE